MHFDVESMPSHISLVTIVHAYIVVLLSGNCARRMEYTFISRQESVQKSVDHKACQLTKMIPSNRCLNQAIVSSLVTRCPNPTRALRSLLLATRIPGLPITT